MIRCPHCQSDKRQNKFGRTRFGSQRYFCCACERVYTPQPKPQGHSSTLRQQALRYSLEGLSQHKVARLLNVSQQSVGNWLKAAHANLEQQKAPEVPPELAQHAEQADEVVELDELHTFIGQKRGQKNNSATS